MEVEELLKTLQEKLDLERRKVRRSVSRIRFTHAHVQAEETIERRIAEEREKLDMVKKEKRSAENDLEQLKRSLQVERSDNDHERVRLERLVNELTGTVNDKDRRIDHLRSSAAPGGRGNGGPLPHLRFRRVSSGMSWSAYGRRWSTAAATIQSAYEAWKRR
jgi:hypothetical protein